MSNSKLPDAGDTIGGKYRIEAMIGRGGMSVVYGAIHQVTGRRFAIKLLLPEISSNPDSAKRFVREAQISGHLQHPNVVEIFDIGEDIGSHYMVMEWLDGESLAERIERAGPLSLTEMTALLVPCMRGVAAAHAAGIVHRDLKPANIFICKATRERPEQARVLDFGISKLSTGPEINMTMTHTGVVMGTPHYMSPEQMQGQPVDARTDVYAFGIILYQVFAARLPFPARTYGELVMQIATGQPDPLEQLVPWLPAALARVLSRAMVRDLNERYQNMNELIAAIEYACGPNADGYDRDTKPSIDPRMLPGAASTPWAATFQAPVPLYAKAISRARYRRFAIYGGGAALVLLVGWLTVWIASGPAGSPPQASQPPATAVHAVQGVGSPKPEPTAAGTADVPPQPQLAPNVSPPAATIRPDPTPALQPRTTREEARAREQAQEQEDADDEADRRERARERERRRALEREAAERRNEARAASRQVAAQRELDRKMELDAPSRPKPPKTRARPAAPVESEAKETPRSNPLQMQIQ